MREEHANVDPDINSGPGGPAVGEGGRFVGDDVVASDLSPSQVPFDEPGEATMDEMLSADESRLIELVGFLVQSIVAHPDEVEVEEFFDDQGVVYGVRVHPEDVGRVIGRDGRVANALRLAVKAASVKTGERVTVEIITDDSQLQIVDEEPAR
jgi:predicted RNA-binding protein YlqC (UPF0109 family)